MGNKFREKKFLSIKQFRYFLLWLFKEFILALYIVYVSYTSLYRRILANVRICVADCSIVKLSINFTCCKTVCIIKSLSSVYHGP